MKHIEMMYLYHDFSKDIRTYNSDDYASMIP